MLPKSLSKHVCLNKTILWNGMLQNNTFAMDLLDDLHHSPYSFLDKNGYFQHFANIIITNVTFHDFVASRSCYDLGTCRSGPAPLPSSSTNVNSNLLQNVSTIPNTQVIKTSTYDCNAQLASAFELIVIHIEYPCELTTRYLIAGRHIQMSNRLPNPELWW